MTAPESYVLGTSPEELERLGRQHQIWRDDTLEGWRRAGFGPGQRILDLGCGPGFAALDLAAVVGKSGRVLAVDSAAPYLAHLQHQANARQLAQLGTLTWDLNTDRAADAMPPLISPATWDGAWCRWVAMFLNEPEALVRLIARALRPGGRLVLHEYVQWDTFALVPDGVAVARFVQRCIGHWQASGGDPHIARRLPTLLERHGLGLVQARSLQACERGDGAKALWLQDFLRCYSPQLAAAGLWSPQDQRQLEAELQPQRRTASLWVTPSLVEMIWERR
jgi:SAM-dependent methyltransferase